MSFGKLVDEARRGQLSRRGFLSAALALGVGGTEARHAISAPRIVQVPAPAGKWILHHPDLLSREIRAMMSQLGLKLHEAMVGKRPYILPTHCKVGLVPFE